MAAPAAIGAVAAAANPANVIAAMEFASGFLPAFEENCAVTVRGNRKSKMADLYFVALATAIAKCANRTAPAQLGLTAIPPPGGLFVDSDLVKKEVHVELKYQYSAIANLISATTGVGGRLVGLQVNGLGDVITNGPTDDTVGRKFDIWGRGPLFNALPLPRAPDIKRFEDKVILTDEEVLDGKPVEEPKPPGDNGLRGSYLEFMVFQALSDPCVPPDRPPAPRRPPLPQPQARQPRQPPNKPQVAAQQQRPGFMPQQQPPQ